MPTNYDQFGKPNFFPQVEVKVPMDEFENAIRKIGIINACEWFGYPKESQTTRDTIEHFELIARLEAPQCGVSSKSLTLSGRG